MTKAKFNAAGRRPALWQHSAAWEHSSKRHGIWGAAGAL